MIDTGLLLSIALVLIVPWLWSRRTSMPTIAQRGLYDEVSGALLVGLIVSRLAAMALDNPGGLLQVRDLLVIRSGMEFWPGMVAGAVTAAWRAHRHHVPPLRRLADLAPFGLIAYATYEAACLGREGCYGPVSPLGLVPDGLTTRVLPVGLLVALAVGLLAVLTFRMRTKPPGLTIAIAVGGLALARAVASIWLPRVGTGLTRQHLTSLTVLAVIVVSGIAFALTGRSSRTAVPGVFDEGGA